MVTHLQPGFEEDGFRYLGGDPSVPDSWEPIGGGLPQVGEVDSGFRFIGGDPRDPANWEQLEEPGYFSNMGSLLVDGGRRALTAARVSPSVISGDVPIDHVDRITDQLQRPAEADPLELQEVKGAFEDDGQAWEDAEGFLEHAAAIGGMLFEVGRQTVTNPKGLSYLTAEQAANMVPSIVGMLVGAKGGAAVGGTAGPVGAAVGAFGGAAAGAFAGSAPIEVGSEFISLVGKELADRGLDPTHENVSKLLQDQEFTQRAIADARVKGATTAGIDAAMTVVSGGIATGPRRAALKAATDELGAGADAAQIARRASEILDQRTVGQSISTGGKAVGVDVAGGGISEAGGQLAAYGEVDLADVGLEMLGELGGTAIEVPAAARAVTSHMRRPADQGGAGPAGAPLTPTPIPSPEAVQARSQEIAQQALNAAQNVDEVIEAANMMAGRLDDMTADVDIALERAQAERAAAMAATSMPVEPISQSIPSAPVVPPVSPPVPPVSPITDLSAPPLSAIPETTVTQETDPPVVPSAEQAPPAPRQAEVSGLDVVPPGANPEAGARATVVTPAGRPVDVRYRVVDAADLVTSHTTTGAVNPQYPASLQPRDRSRGASEMQIHEIASNLVPDLLGTSNVTSDGAPIISAEGIVESGNGRTLALARAYDQNMPSALAYRGWLQSQGYDVSGMRAPVLVRQRETPMSMADLEAYTRESNERTTAAMSDTEQAQADAQSIAPIIGDFVGGDLTAAANRDFVRKFMRDIASPASRGELISPDGVISQRGQRRIQAALMASAYDSPEIVADLFESSDSDIKAIGGALQDVSGRWAQMREAARSGAIPSDMDITPNLVEAVNLVRRARAEGVSINELANQVDMLSGETDPATMHFLRLFFRGDNFSRARSRGAMASALGDYISIARSTPAGENMFEDAPPTGTDILGTIHERQQRSEATGQQSDFFASPERAADSPGQSVQEGRGPGAAAVREPAPAPTSDQQPRNREEGVSRQPRRRPTEARDPLLFGADRGVPVDQARAMVERITANLPGASNVEILAVRNRLDVDEAEGVLPSMGAEGIYFPASEVDGQTRPARIYLMAQALPTMERAEQVLAHELVGHFGMEAMLGERFSSVLEDVIRIARAPEGVDVGIQRVGDPYYATMDAVQLDYPDYSPANQAREVLARMAETNVRPHFLEMVYAHIRRFLRSLGIRAPLSASEIKAMVVDSAKQLRRTPGGQALRGSLSAAESLRTAEARSRRSAPEARTPQAPQREGLSSSGRQQTDTPEFRRWFGDSKVVDAEGTPLVVYHGSPDLRFIQEDGTFKSERERYGMGNATGAHWFTASPVTARSYADPRRAFDYQNAEEGVIPVYLKIENPLVIDAGGTKWRQAQRVGRTGDVIREAIDGGHDGIIIRNVRDDYQTGVVSGDKPTDTYMVFESTQIKSATDNRGTFNPDSANILESRAPASQVDTPAFREWFGNSQVMDDQGRPEVVYHGTSGNFSVFSRQPGSDAGFHFGSQRAANERLRKVGADSGQNIMPVYLSIQNPITLEDRGRWDNHFDLREPLLRAGLPREDVRAMFERINALENRLLEDGVNDEIILEEVQQATARELEVLLARHGYDGIRYENQHEGDGVSWAVFRPEQIKSAIGNRGTFDAGSPDIMESRATNIFGQPVTPTWDAPADSKLADFIYIMQDKHVDTRDVVKAIEAKSGAIEDRWNPYLQEELYHGRAAKATEDFLNDELRPLLQEMQARNVKMEEFETYLHNLHAEERNEQIAKVNPAMPDGGSGINTADAQAYLAGLDPDRRRAYEALARRVQDITAGTRELLVRSGLEAPETIRAWENTYSNYVPLQREDMDFGQGMGTGQGYSIRGSSSRRAIGSSRGVVDILANIAMQRERAITRAEKNRVAIAMYGLATLEPNTDFWMAVNPQALKDINQTVNELVQMGLNPLDAQNLISEPKQAYIDPRTGLVAYRVNPAMRNNANVMSVRVNGQERYVFFNERNPRGQRMVSAMKNLDADQLGRAMGYLAQVTRWFAAVNTQYNPIFGTVNFTRDTQAAMLQLSTTELHGKEAQVLAKLTPALRGIYSQIRAERNGKTTNSVYATLWDQFQRVGGKTGYRDQFLRSDERARALEKELKKISEGKTKQFGRAIFDWLSDYNDTMENAVRLAAFKTALDNGITAERAASIAKNLTVNFNRKGQIATQASAMYAFFNAAVQGTTRMLETLRGPIGGKVISGGLLLGVMQALALSAAGYDEEEPPEFVRERSLIIPLGTTGKYITIPYPLGFNVLPNTGRVLTEYAMSGWRDPTKRIAQISASFMDMFNPIGHAGWSAQTIAPTAVDPLVALSENRDWTGKPIAREDFSSLNPTPGYTRAKETASVIGEKIAYALNAISGGTDFKPGLVSPTPDQIDYLIGQVFGGVGREANKTIDTGKNFFTGEETPPYKIPLVGRFYGNTQSGAAESSRFYNNVREINMHQNEIKGRREAGRDVMGYLRDNPEARLSRQASRVESDIRKMRQRRRRMLENDASRESIKLIEEQITRRMKTFNDQVRRLRDNAPGQ